MIRTKKAEVTSQMFMYIAAAIIAGVILIIGANAIMKLTKTQKDAGDILFKDSVTAYFDTVNSLNFGSERVKDFKLMSEFKTICFISRDAIKAQNVNTPYDEIDNAVGASSKNNVYLISSKTTQYFEVIDIFGFSPPLPNGPFYCYDIMNSKITLRLRAKGDSVEVVSVK